MDNNMAFRNFHHKLGPANLICKLRARTGTVLARCNLIGPPLSLAASFKDSIVAGPSRHIYA
jgi:hypothetical protein